MTIKIKRSSSPGKVPTTFDLQLGELAMNTYDGRLYLKKDDGAESVVEVSSVTRQDGSGAVNRNIRDKIKDFVNVFDFGAKGDRSNDTQALQDALNSLGATGGTVYLKAGKHYNISSDLTIPANCTLKGVFSKVGSPKNNVEHDYTLVTSIELGVNARIILKGGAGVDGCLIYPTGLVSTVPSDSAFTGQAFLGQGDDCFVTNSMVLGFDLGFFADQCQRVKLKDVYFDCRNCVHIKNCYDVPYLDTVHCWPFLGVNGTGTALQRSGFGIKFELTDWPHLINCFTFGYNRGIIIQDSNEARIVMCDIDGTTSPYNSACIGIAVTGTSLRCHIVSCNLSSQSTGLYFNTSQFGIYSVHWVTDTHVSTTENQAIVVESGAVKISGGGISLAPYGIGVGAGTVAGGTASFSIDNFRFSQITTTPFRFDSGANSDCYIGPNIDYGNYGQSKVATGGMALKRVTAGSNTLVLPHNGDRFEIVGTDFSTMSFGYPGRKVTLVFAVALVMTSGTGEGRLFVNGPRTTYAGMAITFISNGTVWLEAPSLALDPNALPKTGDTISRATSALSTVSGAYTFGDVADPFVSATGWKMEGVANYTRKRNTGPYGKGAVRSAINTALPVSSSREGINSGIEDPATIANYPFLDSVLDYTQNDCLAPVLTLTGTFDATGITLSTPLTGAQLNLLERVQYVMSNTSTQYAGVITSWTATRINLLGGSDGSCWHRPGSGVVTSNQVPSNSGPFLTDQTTGSAFTTAKVFIGAATNYFGNNLLMFYNPSTFPNSQVKQQTFAEWSMYNLGAAGALSQQGMTLAQSGATPNTNSWGAWIFGNWDRAIRISGLTYGKQVEGQNWTVDYLGNASNRSQIIVGGTLPAANFGGALSTWNTITPGSGATEFMNLRGGGSGGHLFRVINPDGTFQAGGLNLYTDGSPVPNTDNLLTLGKASFRYANAYFAVAATVGSDQALKTPRRDFTDAELDAYGEVQHGVYQLLASVEEKGAENARLHSGTIAQDWEDAFARHGLDVSRYAVWCADPKMKTVQKSRIVRGPVMENRVTVVETPEVQPDGSVILRKSETTERVTKTAEGLLFNEDGTPVMERSRPTVQATFAYTVEEDQEQFYDEEEPVLDENGQPVVLRSLRYSWVIAFEAAFQRRRADRMEARLTELESKSAS